MANKIVHVEIPARKTRKLMNFYESVFGWRMEKIPKIQCWTALATKVDKKGTPTERGVVNSSIFQKTRKLNTVGIMVQVPNAKRHIRKIVEMGGKVVEEPEDMGEMGIYARVCDPEGNMITLWQSK
jgi:predicted enzyme related to lactoylglutathione lyase